MWLCFEKDGVAEANGFVRGIKLFDEGTRDILANVGDDGRWIDLNIAYDLRLPEAAAPGSKPAKSSSGKAMPTASASASFVAIPHSAK